MGIKQAIKRIWTNEDNETDKIQTKKNNSYEFNEIDRQHSLEMRRIKAETNKAYAEMERIRQQHELQKLKEEIADLTNPITDNDGDNTDNMLMTLLLPLLTKNQNVANSVTTSNPPPTTTATVTEISDEEIREFIKQQDKKFIKIAKSMPKGIVLRQAQEKMNLSQNESERAYKILVEEF